MRESLPIMDRGQMPAAGMAGCRRVELRMKITCLVALVLTAFAVPAANAQSAADFPNAPVKILVPFAAGGPTDVVARILGEQLSARWSAKAANIKAE